jgi:hypothetical protein
MNRVSIEPKHEVVLASWLLRRALAIDHFHRGFLADVLRLPIGRRQASFAALSRIDDPSDIEGQVSSKFGIGSTAEFARLLLAKKVPEVVEIAFGKVPAQFGGALIRCGQMCFSEPTHYTRLFQIFDEPEFERARRVILELGRISSHTIRLIDDLDPLLLDHRIVFQFRDVEDAKQITEAFRLIRSMSSTSDGEWRQMAQQVAADGGKIMDAVRRWTERADRLPTPPFHGGDVLRPLSSAGALVEAAGRFRNCLKSKIHLVMSGRVAYYEFTGNPAAIVEIAPLSSGGWGIIGIYGVANEDINPRLVPTVAADLIKFGVVHQTVPDLPEGYGALLSILRAWDDPFIADVAV